MLCRVDKLSSTITSFNVKRKEKKQKHKKKSKCGHIVFLSHKNIFSFNSLIWILKYIKILLIKWPIL